MWRELSEFMGKYVLKRLLHGAVSVIIVVIVVMVLIYSLMNRNLIFAQYPNYTHQSNNNRITYTYQKWEDYGYLDYVTYADYINQLQRSGEIDSATRDTVVSLGRKAENDSEETAEYVQRFTEYYESQGYTVQRLDVVMSGRRVANGGQQQLFAYRDIPVFKRALSYFVNLLFIDDIHYVSDDVDIGERGVTFTWFDPVYGGEKFSPAIIGNGTYHKYLLYCDSNFPYIHQNVASIRLGLSYSVNMGVDVFDTMSLSQGTYSYADITYPSGHMENSADDLHSATYMQGSRATSALLQDRFTDDYTNVASVRSGHSKLGYSFIIGIISVIMAYVLGLPVGLAMALRKDKLLDKLGTIYIMFIIAVPSLAYIFMFKAVGGKVFGLPTLFDMDSAEKMMYILPIVSLALPSIANLMKWMRRYMIDQMNSDYVKFARSGGLSEGEIFTKHIWKNALIPIVHGIPGSVIFAMTGAIITERVYVVPGAGNLLTQAINKYDNGVIVGVTLFYAVLSVVSLILGDLLMATVDPRISFSTKER